MSLDLSKWEPMPGGWARRRVPTVFHEDLGCHMGKGLHAIGVEAGAPLTCPWRQCTCRDGLIDDAGQSARVNDVRREPEK